MATLNVGAMAARLGLDPSDFMQKMQGVQGFNGFVSSEMRREWRKTGRDGQEAIRLIDEAIGIHVARPVARIIAETLPGLSKALSSVLGGVAFGALAIAGTEFIEHINHKMDEAAKKEEEYREAVHKTQTVLAEGRVEHEKRMAQSLGKTAQLQGDTAGALGFKAREEEITNLQRFAKEVDAIAEAETKEAKAAAARSGFWSSVGTNIHEAFTRDSVLNAERISSAMESVQNKVSLLAQQDALHGTTKSADYINARIKDADRELKDMQAHQEGWLASLVPSTGNAGTQHFTAAEIEAQAALLRMLREMFDRKKDLGKEDDADKKLKAIELTKRHAEEMRSEIESVRAATAATRAKADAEILSASALEKNTAAAAQTKAGADAQREIDDLQAAANRRFLSDTNQRIGATKEFTDELRRQASQIQANQTITASFSLMGEGQQKLSGEATRIRERMHELDMEAQGAGRVAAEIAKNNVAYGEQARVVSEMAKQFDFLKSTLGENSFEVGEYGAALRLDQGRLAQIGTDVDALNKKIQQQALSEELRKIGEQADRAASPAQRLAAEFSKIVRETSATPRQFGQVMDALGMAEEGKGWNSVTELTAKLREIQAENAAIASGSPFPKVDAEIQKLIADGKLLATNLNQIADARSKLERTAAQGMINKAYLSVDAVDPQGGRATELQIQIAALEQQRQVWQDSGRDVSAVTLAIRELIKEQDDLLVKTGGIGAGFHAWVDELRNVESSAQFTKTLLDDATKNAETNLAKMLTLWEQHSRNVGMELRKMWSQYFASLEEQTVKYAMSRAGSAIASKVPGSDDKGFKGALGQILGAGKNPGATLTTAGTRLIAAAQALQLAAASLKSGGGGGLPFGIGGGGGDSGGGGMGVGMPGFAGDAGDFASGGYVSPGSSFISGEAGAEEVRLGADGGATVIPRGWKSGSGGSSHYYDMRGAVVTDDLMRKADAAKMMSAAEKRGAAQAVTMSKESSLRSRP